MFTLAVSSEFPMNICSQGYRFPDFDVTFTYTAAPVLGALERCLACFVRSPDSPQRQAEVAAAGAAITGVASRHLQKKKDKQAREYAAAVIQSSAAVRAKIRSRDGVSVAEVARSPDSGVVRRSATQYMHDLFKHKSKEHPTSKLERTKTKPLKEHPGKTRGRRGHHASPPPKVNSDPAVAMSPTRWLATAGQGNAAPEV